MEYAVILGNLRKEKFSRQQKKANTYTALSFEIVSVDSLSVQTRI